MNTRAVWEAEMLCLRPARTDAVVPEFDPRVHVVEDAPPPEPEIVRWVAGMDFGYRAPTVILWGALDVLGVLWIVGERSRVHEVTEEHVETLASGPFPRPEWIGVDPAGNQAQSQSGRSDCDLLRRAGFSVRARSLTRQESLKHLRARLRPAAPDQGPRLYIHRRCRTLIESLEKHHYPPDRPESLEPVKDGTDHAVDALRYLVQNLDVPVKNRASSYVPAG